MVGLPGPRQALRDGSGSGGLIAAGFRRGGKKRRLKRFQHLADGAAQGYSVPDFVRAGF